MKLDVKGMIDAGNISRSTPSCCTPLEYIVLMNTVIAAAVEALTQLDSAAVAAMEEDESDPKAKA